MDPIPIVYLAKLELEAIGKLLLVSGMVTYYSATVLNDLLVRRNRSRSGLRDRILTTSTCPQYHIMIQLIPQAGAVLTASYIYTVLCLPGYCT